MDHKDRLIDKIKALFALSKSPNQSEAELALAKANELMEKYQISMKEVSERELGSVTREEYEVAGVKTKYNFIYFVAKAAAELFDCACVTNNDLYCNKFDFIGYPNDIEAARATFEYLWGAWLGICDGDLRRAKEEHANSNIWKKRWGPGETIKYKASHGFGFSIAVLERCQKLANSRKTKVSSSSPVGNQIVLVKGHALKEYTKKAGIRESSAKTSLSDRSAANDGRTAGNNIPLRGVGSGQPTGRIGHVK